MQTVMENVALRSVIIVIDRAFVLAFGRFDRRNSDSA